MRLPERFSSLFRRNAKREQGTETPVGLLGIARALLSDDDADAERVAHVIARRRESREREAAERRERDEAQRRRDASAREIEASCRRFGFWWPSDFR